MIREHYQWSWLCNIFLYRFCIFRRNEMPDFHRILTVFGNIQCILGYYKPPDAMVKVAKVKANVYQSLGRWRMPFFPFLLRPTPIKSLASWFFIERLASDELWKRSMSKNLYSGCDAVVVFLGLCATLLWGVSIYSRKIFLVMNASAVRLYASDSTFGLTTSWSF